MSGISRVESAVAARNADAAGALIAYLPVGFPDLDTSIDAAVAVVETVSMCWSSALPYSDPVMDGPVIQVATGAALAGGFRVRTRSTPSRRFAPESTFPCC